MSKAFEKFIFLAVLVFFAAFYFQSGLEASKEERGGKAVVEVKDLNGSIESSDREVGNSPFIRTGNVIGATAPIDNKLSFFRTKSTPSPQILAKSILVGDITTGEIYHSVSERGLWPMASISKLMSAVIVMDKLKMDALVSISFEDLIIRDSRFINIFSPGTSYSVEDLFKAMLIASSNESAEVLAGEVGRENFIKAMNEKAKEWELTSTFFKDPAGISASNQSSASDLFKLTQIIYKNYPKIIQTTSVGKSSITEKNSGNRHVIYSTHQLSNRAEFLGGKTGTTPEAGENLLTLISYGGRPIAIIVLGTETRFEDTNKLIQWFKNDFSPGY